MVVNEFGETIGILTFADILATLFHAEPQSQRSAVGPGADPADRRGRVACDRHDQPATAGTPIFKPSCPPPTNVTVGGVMQDLLQRLAEKGDEVDWGPFPFSRAQSPPTRSAVDRSATLPPREEPNMIWIVLLLLAVGMFLSAFFSGSETGFYRVTRVRLLLDGLGGDLVSRHAAAADQPPGAVRRHDADRQ